MNPANLDTVLFHIKPCSVLYLIYCPWSCSVKVLLKFLQFPCLYVFSLNILSRYIHFRVIYKWRFLSAQCLVMVVECKPPNRDSVCGERMLCSCHLGRVMTQVMWILVCPSPYAFINKREQISECLWAFHCFRFFAKNVTQWHVLTLVIFYHQKPLLLKDLCLPREIFSLP